MLPDAKAPTTAIDVIDNGHDDPTIAQTLPPTKRELWALQDGMPAVFYWCNFDDDTDEGLALVLQCQGEADLNGDDILNTDIYVKALFAAPVEKVNRATGELVRYLRIVLVLEDGRTVSFGSNAIRQAFSLIVAKKPQGPWNPPLHIKISQVPLPDAKRTYSVRFYPPQLAVKKGGK